MESLGRQGVLMTARIIIVVAALLAGVPGAALAAGKVAVFPFILTTPVSEDDFFIGKKATSPEEQARLRLAHEEFSKLITAGGYVPVDLSSMAADIEAQMPINECNGCEIDLSKKAGADIAFVVLVEKASATVLNLSVSEVDVAKAGVKRNMMAVIQGNTDDAWLGGIRWIVKNRILKQPSATAKAP
jgi:hypothetical protein